MLWGSSLQDEQRELKISSLKKMNGVRKGNLLIIAEKQYEGHGRRSGARYRQPAFGIFAKG